MVNNKKIFLNPNPNPNPFFFFTTKKFLTREDLKDAIYV